MKLEDLTEKNISEYKKSTKICSRPLVVETKETVLLKEGDIFKDRTKSSLNLEPPRRDVEKFTRKDNIYESKRELVIKQRTYQSIQALTIWTARGICSTRTSFTC